MFSSKGNTNLHKNRDYINTKARIKKIPNETFAWNLSKIMGEN